MILKIRHIGLRILGLFLLIGFSIQVFANSWELLKRNSYVILNQSSNFTFQTIKNHTEPDALMAKARSIVYFDKINYETWQKKKISNEDILNTYAQKPDGLAFVKCERLKNSQTIIKATYQVSGKESKEVEDFLVENYGMGKLKWTCCGWDNQGKNGQFEHAEFKKIDPYCSAMISMFASGEVGDKNEQTGFKLETDRTKIDYFTVIVELVIV